MAWNAWKYVRSAGDEDHCLPHGCHFSSVRLSMVLQVRWPCANGPQTTFSASHGPISILALPLQNRPKMPSKLGNDFSSILRQRLILKHANRGNAPGHMCMCRVAVIMSLRVAAQLVYKPTDCFVFAIERLSGEETKPIGRSDGGSRTRRRSLYTVSRFPNC